MRISSIQNNGIYNNRVAAMSKRNLSRVGTLSQTQAQPAFKGCDVFKVVGFIAGAAAVVAVAPAVAMAGLAGVGALPGAIVGAIIDEKIDEHNNDGSKDNNRD